MTSPSPSVDPVRERIAEQVKKIKSEFDLGGYFSDRKHTEMAEGLLDSLGATLTELLDICALIKPGRDGRVRIEVAAVRSIVAAGLGVTP